MRQPWLTLEITDLVRPAEPRLDPVDLVLAPAVRATDQVSRANLISLLEQHGYATAKTAVTQLPYLERVSRGQNRVFSVAVSTRAADAALA